MPKARYYVQKSDAKRRGIAFQFTFEEWCNWWETNLGPDWFILRGKLNHQYCMARKGDEGPYAVSNVYCPTNAQNYLDRSYHTGGNNNSGRKLSYNRKTIKITSKQAVQIFKMQQTQKHIAKQFGVSERLVRMIKAKQVWKHFVDDL